MQMSVLTLGNRWRAVLVTLGVVAVLLPITEAADAAPKRCAVNGSTDLYVNPAVKRKKPEKEKDVPTGIPSPANCTYPSITAAIEEWEARDLGAGARIILTGATATTPAVLSDETFPLALPAGATLTTTDDPALGGGGLNPANYIVPFSGSSGQAFQLQGADIRGVSVSNDRVAAATAMVDCGAGTVTLDTVTLDGSNPGGGQVGTGLHLLADCELSTEAVRVRGFNGNGVVVEEDADLTMDLSKVYGNGGDGITIRGRTALSQVEVAFNGDDGILVEESTSSSFHALDVRDNGGNGFEIHPSNVSFAANTIHNNSRSTGWDEAQLLFVGPVPPEYGEPYWTGSEYVQVYRIGPVDCDDPDAQPNRIHSYNTATDPTGSSEHSVGLYASQGAGVWADNNSWRTGDEAQNVDQDADSFVDADTICPAGGILLILDPSPGPPVE